MVSYLLLTSATLAYVIFSYAMVNDYQALFHLREFCTDDEDTDQCIPCPANARCLKDEIQCDERYQLQGGQCIPVHLDDSQLPKVGKSDDSSAKQLFYFAAEIWATVIFVAFLAVQLLRS
jgi:hypothetical protein